MTKLQLYKILFLSSWWVCSSIFSMLFEATALGFKSAIVGLPYDFGTVFLIGVTVSICSASATASFEVLWFDRILRKRSFGITILIKTSFYLTSIFVFLSIALIGIISDALQLSLLHNRVIEFFIREYILSGRFLMHMIYWGFSIVMVLFILQVSDKFGPGVLWEFIKGKYHSPKEEKRIFMFMDLKSSTAYGEKLGHIQYSRMLQECYFDLTDVVTKYKARIYQYVGDEVVMTWDVKSGITSYNCVKTYLEYDKLLQEKRKYYEGKFDVVPEFKASLHIGRVTAAEVGELKKELAYHGDVLNTAARIQEKCNELESKLLISEEMKNALGDTAELNFAPVGKVLLKGKERPVNIYKVESRE
jgi:adenylate cyclase